MFTQNNNRRNNRNRNSNSINNSSSWSSSSYSSSRRSNNKSKNKTKKNACKNISIWRGKIPLTKNAKVKALFYYRKRNCLKCVALLLCRRQMCCCCCFYRFYSFETIFHSVIRMLSPFRFGNSSRSLILRLSSFPSFLFFVLIFFRHIVFAWRQWWWWWCLLLSLLLPFIRQSVYCGNNIHFGNTLTEPVTTILGGPDLYIDIGSTINLTCIVRHLPEPPSAILWSHKNQVCKSSLNTWR